MRRFVIMIITAAGMLGGSLAFTTPDAEAIDYTIRCRGSFSDGTAWEWEGSTGDVDIAADMLDRCEYQGGTFAARMSFWGVHLQDEWF